MSSLPVRHFNLYTGVPFNFPGCIVSAALEGEGGFQQAQN
jgi:hypothetical protein